MSLNDGENKINPDILPPPISIDDVKPNELHIRRSPTTKPSSRLSSPSSTRLISPSSTRLSLSNSLSSIPFIEEKNKSSDNINNSSSIANISNNNNSILAEIVENDIDFNGNKSKIIHDNMNSNQSSDDSYIIDNTKNDVELIDENWKPSYGDIVWVQPHSSLPYWPAYVSDPTLLPFDPHGMTTFLNVTTKYKKYAVYMYASKLWDFAKASQMKSYSEGLRLGYCDQQIDQSTELLFSQAIANANLEILLEPNARVTGVLNNRSVNDDNDHISPSSHSTLTHSTDDGVTTDLDQPILDDSPPIVNNVHIGNTTSNKTCISNNNGEEYVNSTEMPLNSASCSEASSGVLVESDNRDDLSINDVEMKQMNPDTNMSIIEGSVIEGWEDVDLDLDDDENIDTVEDNKEDNTEMKLTSSVVDNAAILNTEVEMNIGTIPRTSYITCDVSDDNIDSELSPQIYTANKEESDVKMNSEIFLDELVIDNTDKISNDNQNDNRDFIVSNTFSLFNPFHFKYII